MYQQQGPNPGKPVVSVSILPQKYFIEQLAGGMVEVNVMVPPGASPATYEPTVSQLSQLDRSAVYMKMGYLGFELSWMNKIRSVNPSMEVINLSDGVELIYGEEEDDHQGSRSQSRRRRPTHLDVCQERQRNSQSHGRGAVSLLPDDSLQISAKLSSC